MPTKVFAKPKQIAHLSFALVMIGFAIQSLTVYLMDDNALLIGMAMALYFAAFPFAILTLMRNWRVPREQRIDLWGSIEVGVGFLPFAIAVIQIVYFLWFA